MRPSIAGHGIEASISAQICCLCVRLFRFGWKPTPAKERCFIGDAQFIPCTTITSESGNVAEFP
jgi:hypothetical protein